MTLIEQINEDIKESIRSQNMLRLNTLRMLKSKILTVDARGNLPDTEVIKLFKTYLNNLQEAVEQSSNRPDMVEQLKKEIAIVQEFLPKALSPEETRKIVMQAIDSTGIKSKKDFGLLMKEIKKINPNIDGKLVKEIADQLLSS